MQWKSSNSLHPKKSQENIDLFLRMQRVVHQEFFPPGQTLKHKFYLKVLEHLREQVHHIRPKMFPNKWILHHDNVPSHAVLSVSFLVEKSIMVMEYLRSHSM
jgi:hypothetical protein